MKKKKPVIIIIIIVLAVLLIPIRSKLKDGGSIVYKSFLYEITKLHRISPTYDEEKPYIEGFEVKIFGKTVYRETNE